MASAGEMQAKSAEGTLRHLAGDAWLCIIVVIQFVLADAILRSVFVSFLQFLKAEIIAERTALQVLVAQSTVTLALIRTELQVFSAAASVGDGLANRFPISRLTGCPLIGDPVQAVQGAFGGGPGIASKIAKIKTFMRDLQYKVALIEAKINQLNQKIGQLDLFTSQIDAIIAYFEALAALPVLPPLPLS